MLGTGLVTAPPSSPELKRFSQSNNAFAFDLFAKIRAQKGNLAFSPISLWTGLTMVWAGARGETATQMQKVLHLDSTPEMVLDLDRKLLATYQDSELNVTIHLAKRLFAEKSEPVQQDYLDSVQAKFGAFVEPLDFKHAAEDSRQRINAWVVEATQNRVAALIPKDGIDRSSRLVLAGALYVLGRWSVHFPRKRTHLARFYLTATETVGCPLMLTRTHYRFVATDGVKVLDLPYEGGALVMTLVLPDQVDGLDAIEARLSAAGFDTWLERLTIEKVETALPRFELHTVRSLLFDDALKALGMPRAFDVRDADFSGIATPPAPPDRVYLAEVFHKAFITIDEGGTEATAAPPVLVDRPSALLPNQPTVEFGALHPFLFFVRDVRSGMILLMGRVADPTAN
jgi:serpin B